MQESHIKSKAKTNILTGQTHHLLIKLATAQTKPGFGTDDVINGHNAVVNRHGTVWFGKSGRPVGKHSIELLNSSIEQNKLPQLILVRRTGNEYEYFGARIHAVHTGIFRPPFEQIPEYYRGTIHDISMWIE